MVKKNRIAFFDASALRPQMFQILFLLYFGRSVIKKPSKENKINFVYI